MPPLQARAVSSLVIVPTSPSKAGAVSLSWPPQLQTQSFGLSSGCVDISQGAPSPSIFKELDFFGWRVFHTCGCIFCVPALLVSLHISPAPSDAHLQLFLGCCLSPVAGCQAVGCSRTLTKLPDYAFVTWFESLLGINYFLNPAP